MMREMNIYAKLSGHDKGYKSYRGRVGKVAPNLMKRDFHANSYMKKTGTDVTEFKLPFGRVYLSPIIDFSNNEILAYSISQSPGMILIMDMLDNLYKKHPNTTHMMLHSDQGWQYQMPIYQRSLKEHGIIQSMSRKSNCLDNGKTENFFSVLKKEMFYGHEKEFLSFEEFRKAINKYILWYNEKRIVERLGGAPVQNRSYSHIQLLCYNNT